MPYILEPTTFLANEKTKEVTGYYQFREKDKVEKIIVNSTPSNSSEIQEVVVELGKLVGHLLTVTEPLGITVLEELKDSLPLTRQYLANCVKDLVVPALMLNEESKSLEHAKLLRQTAVADIGVIRFDSKIWSTNINIVFQASHSFNKVKRIYVFALEIKQDNDTMTIIKNSLIKYGLNEDDASELAAKVNNCS